MKISGKTKVSEVIKYNKEAINTFASLNPLFKKLRNPILRKVLAPRVTLSEASDIGKCELSEMLKALEKIGFETENVGIDIITDLNSDKMKAAEFNAFLEDCLIKTLDVRPILAKNEDPFLIIQKALKACNRQEALEVVADFKPLPLIKLQEKNGFDCYHYEENGVHHTFFKQKDTERKPQSPKKSNQENSEKTIIKELTHFVNEEEFRKRENHFSDQIRTVDVRNLEMPQPMITILNELADLKKGMALKVVHKKMPQYLIPELEEKGFVTYIQNIEEGNVLLLIYHN